MKQRTVAKQPGEKKPRLLERPRDHEATQVSKQDFTYSSYKCVRKLFHERYLSLFISLDLYREMHTHKDGEFQQRDGNYTVLKSNEVSRT